MYSVMQVVDSLALGGLESVAVNYANHLSKRGMRSLLCSTRAKGPLEQRLSPCVPYLNLGRTGLIDFGALKRFIAFVRQHQVNLLHAHGTSLFFSLFASCLVPGLRVVWHDHSGGSATKERSHWLYGPAVRHTSGVIAVNETLAAWSRTRLRVPAGRVWYVPNYVVEPKAELGDGELPGRPGKRIVCVANLRPVKDHLSLVDAMVPVAKSDPAAVLLLVGSESNREHAVRVKTRIQQNGLQNNIFLLGSRANVWPILKASDGAVLSSASEGLPLALLEYGTAGLPTVATRVGQIPEVLDSGRAGILVSPGSPAELASALLRLLQSADLRRNLGNELKRHVQQNYSEAAVMEKVFRIYHKVLDSSMQVRLPG